MINTHFTPSGTRIGVAEYVRESFVVMHFDKLFTLIEDDEADRSE